MARLLQFDLGGEVSAFDLARLDRSKLYGRRRRVVVDDAGTECERGLLSEDGATLLPPGGVADLYLDDSFDVVERSVLRAVDDEGNAIPPVASTLGVTQPLTGPVPPARILDFVTPVVYQLDIPSEGGGLGAGLAAALDRGEIFESRFAYRDGFEDQTVFLVKNEAGFFALVGRPTGFEMLRKATPPPAPATDDDDLFEDDLDFGMM